jgi:large subunit ribosomal protein L28
LPLVASAHRELVQSFLTLTLDVGRVKAALVTSRSWSGEKENPEMARVCELCGKGPRFGHRISHAHNLTKRRWNVNLQNVRALVNGATRRLRVCTECIRSGKVQKAA